MDKPTLGPLGDKDYEAINRQLTQLAALRTDIAKARQAGFQCDEHDQMCQFLQQRLAQVKNAYFPTKP
jgi:hypothetical protein